MSVSSDSITCDIKAPKRVLHFSDGVVEEYDSSDEDNNHKNVTQSVHQSDEHMVSSWPTISSVKRSVLWFGTQSLKVCDYLGENLANFLGITSPKYESEVDEYLRRVEEQKNYESKQLSEFSGWSPSHDSNVTVNCADIKHIPKTHNYCMDSEKQRF